MFIQSQYKLINKYDNDCITIIDLEQIVELEQQSQRS